MATVTDATSEFLYSVEHNGASYTPLDVFYTLSQNYTRIITTKATYINKDYPAGKEMRTSDVTGFDLSFTPDGVFKFDSIDRPNPDRAAREFTALVKLGKLIMAPSMTKYYADASFVGVSKNQPGISVYFYKDL